MMAANRVMKSSNDILAQKQTQNIYMTPIEEESKSQGKFIGV